MKKSGDHADVEALLHGNLHRVFSERNADKRMAAIGELWTVAPVMFEAEGIVNGRQAISDQVSSLHELLPSGTSFTPAGPVSGHHDLYVLPWQAGQSGQPPHTLGRDIVMVKNGAIDRLWVFIEKHP